ncbi:MAG: ABC transporter ATP-binding protein [Hyphomicrobiaceae bacterium]
MALTLTNVEVRLGGRRIVEVRHLEVPSGQLICVLGPNGAGKTTLMRAVSGLLRAQGKMRLNGEDLQALTPRARARLLAYLPQGHVAHWPLTVETAVRIGRTPHASSLSRPSPADEAAITRALEDVDASHLRHRTITELSGGERARVMLARALAVEAPVLIADEPVAALDPGHQLGMMALFKRLAREDGRTVILVLHDLTLASRFADRVVILNDGRVAAEGPPREALTAPVLKEVFRIETRRIVIDDAPIVVPWRG